MKKLITLLFTLLLTCSLVGCGRKTDVITSDPVKKEVSVLGTKTETSLELQVNNETGSDITSIRIKPDNGDYGEELIPEGSALLQGQSANLYYNPIEGETEQTEYTVKVVLAGKGEFELSVFPMHDMKKSVTIHSTKGVVFIKYVSLITNEQVSTLDIELEAKKKRDEEEARKKKEQEEEEERQKAEEEAAKQVEEQLKEAQKQQQQQSQSDSTPSESTDSSDTTTPSSSDTSQDSSTEVTPTPEPTPEPTPTPTTPTPILETSPIANSFNPNV